MIFQTNNKNSMIYNKEQPIYFNTDKVHKDLELETLQKLEQILVDIEYSIRRTKNRLYIDMDDECYTFLAMSNKGEIISLIISSHHKRLNENLFYRRMKDMISVM